MSVQKQFSIVIPTYNRPERLLQCLQSITRLDFPTDLFEVVVVDDGSEPSLDSVVTLFEANLPLRFIRQSNAGPAHARNTGAAAASGEYLVFTDDDCQLDSNWLAALSEAIVSTPNALIGGHTVNSLSTNLYSAASQILIDYLYYYFNQVRGEITFFASNNFAVPRSLFHEAGGFDTSFPLAAGEDREFCDRWLQRGFSMAYCSEMIVYHAHYLSFRRFWKQHFNYGRGAYCFHRAKARREHGTVKVEPIKFYWQLLTYPQTYDGQSHTMMLSGLLLLSQVANVSGFFWERYKQQSA